ncbi:MAG TPA: peptidoglycan DD-metalloendopeptidase family protein [Clostridiales bacterium]|nr:peptidoglycan DD-metalloendopeptidase family protein [Clostridiales bacterium]
MRKKILVILLTLALLLGSVCTVHAVGGYYYFLWPVPTCAKMSAGYDDGRNHCAIDIPAAGGSSVIASAAGQVTYVNSSCTHNYGKRYNCCNSIGRVIKIQHFDTINGSPVTTRYGHLSDIYVSVGDYVQAGQVIGTVGSTGYSTGNHLDFKMYAGDQVVDAGPFLQIPADLTYTGSDWANNGAYLTQLKSYNNTVYGGTAIISITTSGISVEPSTPAPTKNYIAMTGAFSYPILLIAGTPFNITGTCVSNTTIKTVKARIVDSIGVSRFAKQVNVNADAYNIENLASSLKFDKLSGGEYIYEVLASDGTDEYTLIYRPFRVSPDATIIAASDCTHPSDIKPGQSFKIAGTVAATSNITNLTAQIVDTNSTAVFSKTVNPNTVTYNLSGVDADMKFNQLAEGKYQYIVTATDSANNTVKVIDDTFYVDKRTRITGEVTISGLGAIGISQSSLSSPYVERTLKIDTDLSMENPSLSYQWYADDMPIKDETGESLYISKSLLDKCISVKITGTGNYFGTIESEKTQKVTSNKNLISEIIGAEYDYSINLAKQTVGPVLPGTTAKTLMDGVISTDVFNGCYDQQNQKLGDDDILKTGDSLRLMLFDKIVVLKYYVAVLGDITCDGKVSVIDARKILQGALNLLRLDGMYFDAADVNFDGKVNVTDARKVLRVALSLDNLTL